MDDSTKCLCEYIYLRVRGKLSYDAEKPIRRAGVSLDRAHHHHPTRWDTTGALELPWRPKRRPGPNSLSHPTPISCARAAHGDRVPARYLTHTHLSIQIYILEYTYINGLSDNTYMVCHLF